MRSLPSRRAWPKPGSPRLRRGETTCCYAKQDKFWVQGAPDGESWEIYTVLADSQTFYAEGHGPQCCGDTNVHTGDPAASASRCC